MNGATTLNLSEPYGKLREAHESESKTAGEPPGVASTSEAARQILFSATGGVQAEMAGDLHERKVAVLSADEICQTLGEYEIPPNEIVPGLYLGNVDNAYNDCHLKALGVTHILNTAAQAECPHEGKFTYLKLSLLDTDEEDLFPHFEEAIKFIDQAREQGKVLVHCMSGMSRSASLVIAWLIRKNGLGFTKALDLVQEKRSIVQPNEGFCAQLELFAGK